MQRTSKTNLPESKAESIRLTADISEADGEGLREPVANRILERLSEQLKKYCAKHNLELESVLKSAACFGINTSFALMEYIINSVHEKGSTLDCCLHADVQGVTCMVFDNGKGFPDDTLEDYHPRLIMKEGFQKANIVSTKRANKKGGFGIASIDRIMHMAKGKFEIGNKKGVSAALSEKMGIFFKPDEKGAVLILTSPLYTPKAFAAFIAESEKVAYYGNQDNSQRYTTYVEMIDYNAKYSHANNQNRRRESLEILRLTDSSYSRAPLKNHPNGRNNPKTEQSLKQKFKNLLNLHAVEAPASAEESDIPMTAPPKFKHLRLNIAGLGFGEAADNIKLDAPPNTRVNSPVNAGLKIASPTDLDGDSATPESLQSSRSNLSSQNAATTSPPPNTPTSPTFPQIKLFHVVNTSPVVKENEGASINNSNKPNKSDNRK
jgi:hypothetical protein